MTAIVGLVHNNEMHICGDGLITDEHDRMIQVSHPKVFRRKHYLLGCCGDAVAGDIVEATRLPDFTDPLADPHRWMVGELVPAIRQAFREQSYSDDDFGLLVLVNGRIFAIDEKLGIAGPMLSSYHAIGSGADFCIGVMAATMKYGVRYRLRTALEVASLNCSNVGPPFTYLKMGV